MQDEGLKPQIEILMLDLPIILKDIVDLHLEFDPESLYYTPIDKLRLTEDAKFYLQNLFSSIELDSIIIFEHYNRWMNQLFTNLRLPIKTLEIFYDCTNRVMHKRFKMGLIDENIYVKIHNYINHSISALKTEVTFIMEQQKLNPLKALLDEYTRCVLSGDRRVAIEFIMKITKNDAIEVKDIYEYIIKPFQIELGRLWQKNLITVGQEHYATAISQFAMGSLYERIFTSKKNGKVFLGTCAQGDLHEFGIRMVCDFMEYSGWSTYYLGANMTNSEIIKMILNIKPNIIAISCTMTFNISSVKYLISEIKDSGIKIPIIVGGYSLNHDKTLWIKAGADGYSEELDEVLSLSENLSTGGFF